MKSAVSVVTTWCVASLIGHHVLIGMTPVVFPKSEQAWSFLIIAGLAASLAQQITAHAMRIAPVGLYASLSYLTPVLSLLGDAILFNRVPNWVSAAGAIMIVVFGALLPIAKDSALFLKWINRSKTKNSGELIQGGAALFE